MASEEEEAIETPNQALDWKGQYKKIKEHAETYPYVWASYIIVYGGLTIWTSYRWIKLRRTENRVRVLQERLRKLVEAEESASASSKTVQDQCNK